MSVDTNRVRVSGVAEARGSASWRSRLPEIVLVLALLFVAAFLLQRYVAQQVLEREGVLTQQFLLSTVKAEDSEAKLFAQPAPSESLSSFARHAASIPGLLRLNIYSPDGVIRHSSEPNIVGIKFAGNDELAASFAGSLIVHLEGVDDSDKAEHVALRSYGGSELIEAYVPLINDAGKVFGVVEFYRRPDGAGSAIGSITRAIWIAFAAAGAIAVCFWLVLVRRSS